ncbi:erythromycin esterase family protein [Rufibacter radiotolerans]|uniref:erythromycin esterase family protein n=1 Tax=Rufibacter radiotolerans TaxID=1379910 RepID=UPI0006646DC2|nr:erythromycin esterase family protein [Rufibacter radiotolerans]
MTYLKLPYHRLENKADLDILLEDIGDARIVMLGEASHGTSEYYGWRTAISKRLIEEKGFTFIAVEGDWPDCYQVNKFIRGSCKAGTKVSDVLKNFNRWPTWMWGNWEIAALVEWLKEHNDRPNTTNQIGFYGLDVYSLWDSLNRIMKYLEQKDGKAMKAAKEAFKCFEPYSSDPQEYARAVAYVSEDCEDEVISMLQELGKREQTEPLNSEAVFDAEQNALVAVNAERYYKAMIRGGGSSWNVRDEHMMETLNRLLEFHGPDAKAIIWEHNTHVGDARFTDMARAGMVNIGQLAREKYGRENVYLTGFGSYEGSVIAGEAWGAPMKKMEVPPARAGSWEEWLHSLGATDKLLLSRELRDIDEMRQLIAHRAIGVVYDPNREAYGNYVPTIIPERYDAFLYLDETEALRPFIVKTKEKEPPEMYPANE